jgi:hypothetical protein
MAKKTTRLGDHCTICSKLLAHEHPGIRSTGSTGYGYTEDHDITLLSAEEAMRQIVKGNLGHVITPRLLKEGEPVAVFNPVNLLVKKS